MNSFVAEFLAAYAPEGLRAKFEDLWQVCRDHPDIQAMLDEAVQGKNGGDRRSDNFSLYNVQTEKPPAGNTRAAGLRKLRKYAEERADVAEAYEKVLAGEVSVRHCLMM